MIVELTSFKGLLDISTDKIEDNLTFIIEQKEPGLLECWFGYALAKDIQSDSPSSEAQVLIDGVEYTDSSGDLQMLTGLKDLLPYWLYFYIVRDQQMQNSSLGELDFAVENSTKVDPVAKMVQNYNKGVDYTNEMIEYISDRLDVYTTANLSNYQEYVNIFDI